LSLQTKNYPNVYNYKNELLAQLSESSDIEETKSISEINRLKFKYPIKHFDYYGVPVVDKNGTQINSPKIQYLINDNLLLYKDTWYVIKIDKDKLTSENKVYLDIDAYEVSYELTEKYIQYLNLSPPVHDAVNVETVLNEILEGTQQIRDNFVVSATNNTITLDIDSHPSNDFYNDYKIKIIGGNGEGEERTIIDYNGSTKIATLDSNWIIQPDNFSIFRIYNKIWKVGTIDEVFSTDLRGHLFDYSTCFEALNKAKLQYLDSNTNLPGYFTYDVVYNSINNVWEKTINLVKASSYTGIDIRYLKNMQELTRTIDSENIYTKMIFEGKNNLTIVDQATEQRTDNGITYYTHLSKYNEIFNFQYFLNNYTLEECYKNFIKEYHFNDTKYTSSNNMYVNGKKMLEILSMPKITYETTALEMATLSGMEWENFKEGTTVKIYNKDLNTDVYATVGKIIRNENNPQNAKLELTNQVERIGDLLDKIMRRNDSYTDVQKVYGKISIINIAKMGQNANWRSADIVIPEYTEDDALYIQSAIDSFSTNQGEVFLLSGNYLLSSYLNIPENVKLTSSSDAFLIYNITPPVEEIVVGSISGAYSGIDVNADQIVLNVSDIDDNSSSITQNADNINLRVETSDYTGNAIVSMINLTSSSVTIDAENINLVGAVTVLSKITGDLGTITAGTIIGTTFKTSNSGKRLQINDDDLNTYNSSNNKHGIQIEAIKDFSALTFYNDGTLNGGLELAGGYFSLASVDVDTRIMTNKNISLSASDILINGDSINYYNNIAGNGIDLATSVNTSGDVLGTIIKIDPSEIAGDGLQEDSSENLEVDFSDVPFSNGQSIEFQIVGGNLEYRLAGGSFTALANF